MAPPVDSSTPGGIGAVLQGESDQGLTRVRLVIAGSPAEEAGLLAGDLIASVNNWPTTNEKTAAVVEQISGPQGTQVVLNVLRDGVPMGLVARRAATGALADEWARVSKEMCPAVDAAIKDRTNNFANLKGGTVTGRTGVDAWTATTPLATAKDTLITAGLGSTSWVADFGPYASADEASKQLDVIVARFRPCLFDTWVARERDADTGGPIVYFGTESPVGYYGSSGGFGVGDDNRVSFYLWDGTQPLYTSLVNPPGGPWVSAMASVVAAAPDGFASIQGAGHQEGGPFNSWTVYSATVALPGARDCKVSGPALMTGDDGYYQCTVAQNIDPTTVADTFDKVVHALTVTLGSGWVSWPDADAGPHDRHFMNFAKPTGHGYAKTTIVSAGLSETGVTVSVAYKGLSG